MGICGTAMGNVALLMREMGHDVCGADTGVYPPMSDVLAASGIKVFEGYDAKRLAELKPDLVVVGNVTTRGHAEMEWLLETRALPYTSLPALLHDHVLACRRNVVVSGTHGKTTTTTLAAYLMRANGANPGYLIGGVPRDLPSGSAAGAPDSPFAIEGDEYDSAFFDKRSKFIHYLPTVLTINNLEFDHADIFRDLQDVQRTFTHLLRIVPRNGFVLANGDDPNIAALPPAPWTTTLRVGLGESCDIRIVDFEERPEGSSFAILWKGKPWRTVSWGLPGLFNARNGTMAAAAAALALFPQDPTRLSTEALGQFKGVKRRQEILHSDDRLVVVEDFGHHPTAIRETLESLQRRYPGARLLACFEPRSNTARLRVFENALPEAFACAASTYLGPVHRADKVAATDRLDPETICERIRALPPSGRNAVACASNAALLEAAVADCRAHLPKGRQVACFFSNGSFDGIHKQFAAKVLGR